MRLSTSSHSSTCYCWPFQTLPFLWIQRSYLIVALTMQEVGPCSYILGYLSLFWLLLQNTIDLVACEDRSIFLTVLQLGSFSILVRAHFLVHGRLISFCVLTLQKRWGLFHKGTALIFCPHTLNYLSMTLSRNTILWIRFQYMKFWRDITALAFNTASLILVLTKGLSKLLW